MSYWRRIMFMSDREFIEAILLILMANIFIPFPIIGLFLCKNRWAKAALLVVEVLVLCITIHILKIQFG